MLGGVDFERSKAFCLPTDLQGYIRINLKGREPTGTVAPGAEYDRVCDGIEQELRGLRNAESGAPVVAEVYRTQRLYAGAGHLDSLPDLCVLWNAASPVRAVESRAYGRIEQGDRSAVRSGNHRPEGFFAAVGPQVDPSVPAKRGDILDIAPTVFSLLGQELPLDWDGRPLPFVRG